MTEANRLRRAAESTTPVWRSTKPDATGYYMFRYDGKKYIGRRLYTPNRDPWGPGWEWLDARIEEPA